MAITLSEVKFGLNSIKIEKVCHENLPVNVIQGVNREGNKRFLPLKKIIAISILNYMYITFHRVW